MVVDHAGLGIEDPGLYGAGRRHLDRTELEHSLQPSILRLQLGRERTKPRQFASEHRRIFRARTIVHRPHGRATWHSHHAPGESRENFSRHLGASGTTPVGHMTVMKRPIFKRGSPSWYPGQLVVVRIRYRRHGSSGLPTSRLGGSGRAPRGGGGAGRVRPAFRIALYRHGWPSTAWRSSV